MAMMRVEDKLTEEINSEKGVRQACILLSILFNVYSQEIFKKTMEKA